MMTGPLAFVAFLLSIPLANWLILNVGTVCVPHGPCLVPVFPGLMAPSGVVMVGIALVLRDMVQRCLGVAAGVAAIIIGSLVSAFMAPPMLAFASAAAFLLSEFADFSVYTPLQKRRLFLAVVASAAVGIFIDSLAFLFLAFGNLDFLPGQIVGKAWGVLFALPLITVMRRHTPPLARAQ